MIDLITKHNINQGLHGYAKCQYEVYLYIIRFYEAFTPHKESLTARGRQVLEQIALKVSRLLASNFPHDVWSKQVEKIIKLMKHKELQSVIQTMDSISTNGNSGSLDIEGKKV